MSFRSRSSVATNRAKPPLKKKWIKKESLVLPHTKIPSLPDDLLVSCFARISRSYYPTLSLASKNFRSLIASPELYDVRSLLGLTESCLYVCLRCLPDSDTRWFTLCRRPNTRTKKNSSENLLVPVPFLNSPQASRSNLVAIGSSIYSIGGYINSLPSSKVSILDCRTHTWHQAPDMQVARSSPMANVIDGKIYVVGGRVAKDYSSSHWIEVFDPKTQIWNYESSPGREICDSEIISSSAEIDGKLCMYGGAKGVAYNPKDGTFEPIEWDMCEPWVCYSHCVVDEVVFYYHHERGFEWFDTNAESWRDLRGLREMPKITRCSSVRLADFGGKIAVLWDSTSGGSKEKVIWCAVVSLARRRNEIWGRVEWFDGVLTVPESYDVLKVISTTL